MEKPVRLEQKAQLLTKPFEVRLEAKHVKALNKVVNIAEHMKVEELTFQFNGKTLSIRHMDATGIALLKASINIRETLLEDFANEEDESTFSVVLSQLKRALNIEEPNIKLDDRLYVEGKIGTQKVNVDLSLISDFEDPQNTPEPTVNLNVSTTLNVKKLLETVRKLIPEPEKLRFVSNKELNIEFDTDLQTGNIGPYPSSGEGRSCYSVQILDALGSGDWKIEYSTNMPMKATTTITETVYKGTASGTKNEIANIIVWLAPRIEDE